MFRQSINCCLELIDNKFLIQIFIQQLQIVTHKNHYGISKIKTKSCFQIYKEIYLFNFLCYTFFNGHLTFNIYFIG